MRLFVAIPLSEEMRDELSAFQNTMRGFGLKGNYTVPENLHLTLAFIGEYDDFNEVKEVLESVSFNPFKMKLDGLGHFKSIVWAGVKPEKKVRKLAYDVRNALHTAGIHFDTKSFSAHITLLRKPKNRKSRIPEEVFELVPETEMTVDHFSLFSSTRGKNSMIYTEL